ncbi:MAG TPA: hypothetical protein VKN62_07925 [Pelovirga sp.]|nr:hypothetical protein [Pelovirga sp.]
MGSMTVPSKKHPCPDCRHCQWCSDERCRLCLRSNPPPHLSIHEQIALYERLNSRCDYRQDDSDTPESAP